MTSNLFSRLASGLCLALQIAVVHAAEIPATNASPLYVPAFSTAGYFAENSTVRAVSDFNPGWRFFKGEARGAEAVEFDDSAWPVVNLPHGLELLPLNASGSVNYQGPAWYRKHFDATGAAGKRVFLHFEAIMGKSKVWVNGRLVAEHFGGYLPLHLDVTEALKSGAKNVVCVWADNSDDPAYPPGKPQTALDFTYFGGIYRDVWMILTGPVRISDPSHAGVVAGGGVFFHLDALDGAGAHAGVQTHLVNQSDTDATVSVGVALMDATGKTVAENISSRVVPRAEGATVAQTLDVAQPALWHPDHPNLYHLLVTVKDAGGNTLDAMKLRVGLRTVEFRGTNGLFLNGAPFAEKLVGANRHQDFAHLGNALPNTTHWRDAKKLRDAGMRIIRSAHYPQDPAFMDACDELGLFVIVPTPGWQFFREGRFQERSLEDIRQMVRRDRNHPSVFAYEPILNETPYPASYASNANQIVRAEYPYPGVHTGCDSYADSAMDFDLMYGVSHEAENHLTKWRYWGKLPPDLQRATLEYYQTACFFIREFGDNVNDWNAQDSNSRVPKGWGEAPQRVQASHYAKVLRSLYSGATQDIGGCLWHPFDHQRGYHPDPFWGGILDAARQPKYSYWMFMAQRDPALNVPQIATGPFVKILHEATSVSGPDVEVVGNCEQIRLTVNGVVAGTLPVRNPTNGFREIVKFPGVYSFQADKDLIRRHRKKEVALVAEGLIGGRVVATETVVNAGRREKIVLQADWANAALVADGSDIVPVIASVTDQAGRVKRLGQNQLAFTVTGAGTLVNDPLNPALNLNPQTTDWGQAVVLVRAGNQPGTITIRATDNAGGKFALAPAELAIQSVAARLPQRYTELPATATMALPAPTGSETEATLRAKLRETERELNDLRLKETERTQAERATDRKSK